MDNQTLIIFLEERLNNLVPRLETYENSVDDTLAIYSGHSDIYESGFSHGVLMGEAQLIKSLLATLKGA